MNLITSKRNSPLTQKKKIIRNLETLERKCFSITYFYFNYIPQILYNLRTCFLNRWLIISFIFKFHKCGKLSKCHYLFILKMRNSQFLIQFYNFEVYDFGQNMFHILKQYSSKYARGSRKDLTFFYTFYQSLQLETGWSTTPKI